MAAVADLERILERLFERTTARLFRARLQAVQVERRVERAMEAGRAGRGTSTVVPNRFRVRVNPADLDDLATRSDGMDALTADLADRALAFARLHAYHLVARPVVMIEADPIVERGAVEVDASVWRPTQADRVPFAPAPTPAVALLPDRTASPADPQPDAPPGPARGSDASPSVTPPDPNPASHGLRHAADHPYTVRPVPPPAARALLRVLEPGGREREVRVEGQPLTLGRAPDNGLVIADGRVSRHHGRFQTRHGTLVYADLGSTNGTRVNGIAVDEIVLGSGDRLQVGDAVIVVEQLPR